MPHDMHGQQLCIGDIVKIRCRIKEIHPTEEYCNVTLETVEPMFPSEEPTLIHVNAWQVSKIYTKK